MTDTWNEMIKDGVCPLCSGDCGSANPPVYDCPMQARVVGERQPMHEGYEAGIQGLDPRLCPYEKCTKEWREWKMWHGWGVEVYIASLRCAPLPKCP
jgi:hypothetical protein